MPTVVVIPTARPTFAVDVAKQRADAARDLLTDLGATVIGPAELVMTPDDVAAAAEFITDDADLVVNVCASFSDASPALTLYQDLNHPVLLWSFTEPGTPGDRLWLNSLCGANLFGHALVRAGGQVRLIYGDPSDPSTRHALTEVLAGRLPEPPQQPRFEGTRADPDEITPALANLKGLTIGIIGDGPPGFTPSEYDPDLLQELFGITVNRLELGEAFAEIDAVDKTRRQAELADAVASRPTLKSLDPNQVDSFAAVTSALRDWKVRDALSALAIRCWPEFPTQMGVCPCSSMSRIADEGTPTACERDVYGAVTMLLAEALGGGTTYLVDTVDIDPAANIVRVWHCGSAATALAADPDNATQYVHCNRKIGVAGNFALKTGRVVLTRLTEDNDPTSTTGLRLLIAAGESISEPNRFQGNTAAVRLDSDAKTFVHGLVTGGFPHHTVLAWNDIRPQLRQAADQLGIAVVDYSTDSATLTTR